MDKCEIVQVSLALSDEKDLSIEQLNLMRVIILSYSNLDVMKPSVIHLDYLITHTKLGKSKIKKELISLQDKKYIKINATGHTVSKNLKKNVTDKVFFNINIGERILNYVIKCD